MVTQTTHTIKRSEVRANKNKLYLFGDNIARKGLGGQAAEMRYEPNTIGIITKKWPSNYPTSFLSDKELEKNQKLITEDINKAIEKYKAGSYNEVIIPPLGTGLAQLPTKAPETYKFLQQELERLINELS